MKASPKRNFPGPWPWCLALLMAVAPAHAQDDAAARDDQDSARVRVTAPYIELHTGPGRGYPVFFVAGRDEWVQLRLRRTDWYLVRTAGGKEGWVSREQMAGTLGADGAPLDLGAVGFADFMRRRFEFGAGTGQFQSQPMFKVWGTYNLTDQLAAEATYGQVQGVFSGTDLWHVNLITQPFSDRRLSPFFGIGVGKLSNVPQSPLVGASSTHAMIADAAFGVRLHLGQRFVARAEVTPYLALLADNRSVQYTAYTMGLSFFFY